ncbi:MAG TPA: hypothetical protein VM733_00180 [Thermoanaerobaculia bacterium]|nr:hypothetical protein [Thermoanaerobaculia bacterium]
MSNSQFSIRNSQFASIAAVAAVLAFYVWLGSGRTWSFPRVPWERTPQQNFTERYYAGLAEGFLHGRLDMPYPVDARWKNVLNVYDSKEREKHGLAWEMWDASFYNGKFYLYFSPVPVVLFYIPFRLLGGGYPPDTLAATFFLSWAFLVSVAFARRALSESRIPFAIWVLMIGLANVAPFTLHAVRAYEVAVMTGMAMSASFAYALLRFIETRSTKHALWTGVWLALAIATRPNLAVLLLVAVFVLRRSMRFAAIPLAVVGITMAAYNYARFHNPFELGMTYQISYVPMWRVAPCSLCDVPTFLRFLNGIVHYVFWTPHFAGAFPYVSLQNHALDPAVSYAGGAEPVLGIGALNPLVLIATFLALSSSRRGARAALFAAWLILFGLATCRWFTARYALDFMMMMTAASVPYIDEAAVTWRARVVVMAIALFAIATGVLLGT